MSEDALYYNESERLKDRLLLLKKRHKDHHHMKKKNTNNELEGEEPCVFSWESHDQAKKQVLHGHDDHQQYGQHNLACWLC